MLASKNTGVRKKRAVVLTTVALVTAILALTAATVGVGAYVGVQDREISLLATELNAALQLAKLRDENLVTLKKMTLTYADISDKKDKRLAEEIDAIKQHQFEMIQEIQHNMQMLAENISTSALKDTLFVHSIEATHMYAYANNAYLRALDRINLFQSAFYALKDFKLPHELVSPHLLRRSLRQIEENLPPDLTLALPAREVDRYYLESFTSYKDMDEDSLLIQLIVPLQKRNVTQKFNLFAPQYSFYPCFGNCSRDHELMGNGLIKVNLEDQLLYAFDQTTGHMAMTTEHDFVCRPSGTSRFCYSFDLNPIKEPTACHQVIRDANYDRLMEVCPLAFSTNLAEYRIIKVAPDVYSIHGLPRIHYYKDCPSNDTLTDVSPAIGQVTIFPLDPGCRLTYSDQVVYPYSQGERPAIDVFEERKVQFVVPRYGLRPRPLGGVSFASKSRNSFSGFNDLKTRVNESVVKLFELGGAQYAALVTGLEIIGNQSEARIDWFNNRSLRSWIENITDYTFSIADFSVNIIMSIITLILLFSAVRSGQFLYVFSPVLVVYPSNVAAYDFPNVFTDLLPGNNLIDEIIKWVEIIFIITIILVVVYGLRFRRTYVSGHEGRIDKRGSLTRFQIVIEFPVVKQNLSASFFQKITLRMPLRVIDMPTQVFSVENSVQTVPWVIRKNRFELIEKLYFRGLDKDTGEYNFVSDLDVSCNLSKIDWSTSLPIGFASNSYGLACVTVRGVPVRENERKNLI